MATILFYPKNFTILFLGSKISKESLPFARRFSLPKATDGKGGTTHQRGRKRGLSSETESTAVASFELLKPLNSSP